MLSSIESFFCHFSIDFESENKLLVKTDMRLTERVKGMTP
jgi:hypothetical protein